MANYLPDANTNGSKPIAIGNESGARTGLSLDDYVDYVKLTLGAPIVSIEVEEYLPNIVNMAFNELKHYIMDVRFMTVPYSTNSISLKGLGVANVVYVMRAKNSTGPGGFQDIMYIYSRQSALNTYTITDYARALMAQQNKNSIATDLDFTYDKVNERLYLYAQQALPTYVTLVYNPDYKSVEDIIEPFWQNLLKRLAIAMTKEILGRIRGKYTLNSATYSLDADRLLSEAQQELTEIRQYLNTNSDILLPID